MRAGPGAIACCLRSLEPEFRRRHGCVYDVLAKGRISSSCLRHLLAGLSAPARAGEPLMFAIDITPHARPDAQYADERTMVQVRGKGGDRWLPGWPYSLLVGIHQPALRPMSMMSGT